MSLENVRASTALPSWPRDRFRNEIMSLGRAMLLFAKFQINSNIGWWWLINTLIAGYIYSTPKIEAIRTPIFGRNDDRMDF